MIVERSMSEGFLSNTYLVADREGGTAAFIDAGGPLEPLLDAAAARELTVSHVLLTHRHGDHVAELATLRERFPDARVLAHPDEGIEGAEPFEAVHVGELEVRALHTPGHTAGMLSFVVTEPDGAAAVFTGDTLFRGSVGGVRAPGHTTYEDLRASIMDKLMTLPAATVIYPGHTDATTVGEEWDGNAFVRIWRGLDPEGDEPARVWDRDVTLVLWGDDYDGGYKAWIRWPDGSDDIVPGSQVQRAG